MEGAFVDVASLGLHAVEAGLDTVTGAVHVVEREVEAAAQAVEAGVEAVAEGAGRLVDGKHAFVSLDISLCGPISSGLAVRVCTIVTRRCT